MDIVEKLICEHKLSKEEFALLIGLRQDPGVCERLQKEALRLRRQHFGNDVYIRGLIEFTNICKNDCRYCGIRKSNANLPRYRLSEDEILSCCEAGYGLGFRTFVLQGGEDAFFTDECLVPIIRQIKERYPDCAVTLSIGERSYYSYKALREAGADRYLLRHETADKEHYAKLHPKGMSLRHRVNCLLDLKNLGYQTGAGFMVGSPYQTDECLAEDLVFLAELQPEMVGIGPFIPHHDTEYADCPAGSVETTLFLLSVIRIMLPRVLLPATTALGTEAADGRERAMSYGANVVMPNLSPTDNQEMYKLYDGKIGVGDTAQESMNKLKEGLKAAGFNIVIERGDYPT
ncbi:MAG: [FeFe] hydrogenase H-cluster radical SAM maturase HydE [Clostridiales bacterium]|nr:[FeFe] hydrogenase H-cluster radical SAM maturase HydE [Clostridiales bacterium]